MDSEMEALERNGTWDLVAPPRARPLVTCKWLFKLKRDADGNVTRYKARLVARGFSQIAGLDYTDTFAPVTRHSTIRTILAVATARGWHLEQSDISNAYLHADLEEEIYMQQPIGYEKVDGDGRPLACRLKKGLYGLKQAGRGWHHRLARFLADHDFVKSENDPCLFVRRRPGSTLVLAVYVDDLLYGGGDANEIEKFKEEVAAEFKVKHGGSVSWLLGMHVARDEKNLTLSQTSYVGQLLSKFNMEDAHPAPTPTLSGTLNNIGKPTTDAERKDMARVPYKELIGALTYLSMCTRPDISAVVSMLGRFSADPGRQHWHAAKHVLRYLKGTPTVGITFHADAALVLEAYCDADWAGDVTSRRSTTGYIFMLAGAAVSWRSQLQAMVTLSTCEAEYVAVSQCAQEAVFMRRILSDLGEEQNGPTVIHDDNQGAIKLASNPVYHARTKHIDIKAHYIRQELDKKQVALEYCPTSNNIADMLTKPMTKPKLTRFRAAAVGDRSGAERGGVLE